MNRRCRTINSLIGGLGARRWFVELEHDCLLAAAQRRSGLYWLGEDDWCEPLDLILADLHADPALTDLGRIMASRLLTGLLSNRLRVAHAWTEQPTTPPVDPLIILGLPRTGSTLLHELLAEHSAWRAPLFWECELLPEPGRPHALQRLTSVAHTSLINFLAPEFRWIHRVGAARPHECVTIQALSFRSMQFHALLHLPRYSRWLAGCDWAPACLWHARYLALLGRSDPARRWVLKAPGHMHGIDALLKQYPQARFVQLHRDPCLCVPSMASLYSTLQHTTRSEVDDHEIGRNVCAEWRDGLQRVAHARRDPAINKRFVDVDFAALVDNPLDAAARICAFADVELDAQNRQRMLRHLQQNRNPSRHSYTLAQFGLDTETVTAAFNSG